MDAQTRAEYKRLMNVYKMELDKWGFHHISEKRLYNIVQSVLRKYDGRIVETEQFAPTFVKNNIEKLTNEKYIIENVVDWRD